MYLYLFHNICTFFLPQSNSTSQRITTNLYPAEYLQREEIMCPLPRPTNTFKSDTVVYAYVYDISVSNDGEVFSNSISVISYKMDCTECTSKSCNIKVGKQKLHCLLH